MAVSFVARKCTQCAGKLQYIKEKKIWKCLYCGAEIEKQEQYDGLFTIKNVVRQSLLDTAYRRLDSAFKNLIECEKIDSRYVGTVIAKLAYDVTRVITPGACDQKDVKSIFAQLRKTYEQLKSTGATISDDEEALYEFLEEPDIFATLILVYDSLNDIARRDFVAQMLDAKEVYSKYANNNLLSFAIKNEKIDLADQVISNSDNIDVRAALSEVLARYPDSDAKGERIATLLETGGLKYEDRKIIESYLSDTQDSVETKSKTSIAALNQGLSINLDLLLDRVLRIADPETVTATLSAFCKSKIGDEDVFKILSFAYECGDTQIACNAMDCLKNSGQYVLVPAKLIISMLANSEISASDKVTLLKKTFEFKVDHKSFEAVLTNYLCVNQDKADNRKVILQDLLERASNIPTATVENYVLKCSTDGDNKPSVVSAMFDKGLNISFFNDLLSKYMNSNVDSKDIKAAIVEILSQKGLKIDPVSFIEYICSSADELQTKMRFIKKMIANGSQLRSDAANAYLERTAADNFSSELFSMIFTPGSSFSNKAIENYLLRFKERDAIKADNVKTIVDRAMGDVINYKIQITHLGNSITCNLVQAYTLSTNDSQATALKIAEYLVSSKRMKLNEEINVSGSSVKWKKYIVTNKANLSETADAICEKYKVYSKLF